MRRYAQCAASKNHSLEDALDKAKARSKHWEWKVKAGVERITSVEKERDEAQNAWLAVVAVGDAKAWAKDNLARVQDALVIVEKSMSKAEDEIAYLEIEWTSLLLEVGATKDDVCSLQS